MNKEAEKLREMLNAYARAENGAAAVGKHLRDEDFVRLLKHNPAAEPLVSANGDDILPVHNETLAPLREHLAGCAVCLDKFTEFYAFFAPPETGEAVAAQSEIAAAWRSFAPRIAQKKPRKLLARLFPAEGKLNFSAALGWSFAALLLVLTGLGFYTARQAEFESSQLAAQLENQKQTTEGRFKTLEQSGGQNSESAAREKNRLEAEKAELQKQIVRLQTEIERAKRQPQTMSEMTPPTPRNTQTAAPQEQSDNSLVAVNTPIYDVFPADAVVRGGEQSGNKLVIPNAAKTAVLILNAAGRADFTQYKIELIDSSGRTIRRSGGLRKDESGNFTLTLSKAILKTGNYRLRLSGKNNTGSPQTVAEYSIVVEVK